MFSLLMLFLCVILHTMSSGKILQLLCIFPLGMLCFLVVGECPSVLLYFVVMSYVNCGDDG